MGNKDYGPVPSTATSTGRPREPTGLTLRPGVPKSDSRAADASTDEDETDEILPPSPFSVQLALRNIFIAVPLISLILFMIFFPVALFIASQDVQSINDRILTNGTGMLLLGNVLQLDLDAGVATISWGAVVCGENGTSEDPFWDARVPAGCKPFEKPLVVYLNDIQKPIFSSAPHTELISKRVGIWDPPMFITEQRFDRYGRRDPAENLMVPFQRYSFNSFVFAIDPNTNLSIPIKIFGIRDTLGDFVIRSRDAAATSELTYDSGNGLITTQVESRVLRVEITQSAIAKAFAISLFLVNWMLTAGSVYATALVAFRMLDANNVVAALPFSAPFSIPILRSLYVNSPPSGTSVEAAAFFAQMAIVGLCSLIMFGVLASRGSPSSSQGEHPV